MSNRLDKAYHIENKGLNIIQEGGIWAVISFAFATIGAFQVYPFIGLADGFTRWNLALEIVNKGSIQTNNLLSPIIPYIQAITYQITNSFGFYTLLQAALFYMAIGALIRLFIGDIYTKFFGKMIPIWIIVSLLILIIPTVYVFPLMLTDSSPIFILIVFFGWTVLSEMNIRYKATILCVLSFLCVGIRINSLVMFLFIVLICIIKSIYDKRKEYLVYAGTILFGCVVGTVSVCMLSPSKYNTSTLGMVWELVGEAVNTKDKDLIDNLGHYGDIGEAMKRYGDPYLNRIVWDNNPPFPAMKVAGENSKGITQIYLNEVFKHPIKFLFNKWYYVDHTLGISAPLVSSRRGVHGVDDITKSKGALDTNYQRNLREMFFSTTDKISVISLRPLCAFFIMIILILIAKNLNENNPAYLLFPFLAIAYYSSFCINTQAFEYRYYAPTFYIILCTIFSTVVEIVRLLYVKISNKVKNNDT